MNIDTIVSLTNYDPEANILKPFKIAIDSLMLVMYISLCIRTTMRLVRPSSGSILLPLHWLVYYLTEPLMSVVRKAFPSVDTFMVTLLPLLSVLLLYGVDILVNRAFRIMDRWLLG